MANILNSLNFSRAILVAWLVALVICMYVHTYILFMKQSRGPWKLVHFKGSSLA